MGKVHLVLIELKGVSERECVVVSGEPNVLLLVVVLEVGDICPKTMPAAILFLFGSRRKGQDPHSIIVQRVTFGEVENVELDCVALADVGYFEEVPLRVSICVDIILQEHIVLII
jgi:hypothetical protein